MRQAPSTHQTLGGYRAWQLADHAAWPVELAWISLAASDQPLAHRVLPISDVSIAIRRRRDASGQVTAIELVVCSSYTRAFWYQPVPREELIALQVRPESTAVFDLSTRDYLDMAPVPAPRRAYVAFQRALQLAERGTARAVLEQMIRDVAPLRTPARDPCAQVAKWIRAERGNCSILGLAKRLGVSARHLRRQFVGIAGRTPKAYARNLRLSTAVTMADGLSRPDWARIAVETGYYDQAHLVADCTALTGLSPGRLHRERQLEAAAAGRIWDDDRP